MNGLQSGKLGHTLLGPWAGAQAPMPTALGLAGHDRLAAVLCLGFKVCGAGGVFGHVHKGTRTKDHGSRAMDQRPQET